MEGDVKVIDEMKPIHVSYNSGGIVDTKKRSDVNQYYCDKCGETSTFEKDHSRVRTIEEQGKDNCRTCLVGHLVRIDP